MIGELITTIWHWTISWLAEKISPTQIIVIHITFLGMNKLRKAIFLSIKLKRTSFANKMVDTNKMVDGEFQS